MSHPRFHPMHEFLKQKVHVLTIDGRILIGTLVSCDQYINLVLRDVTERIYSLDGVEEESIGVHLLKGDHVATVSILDEEKDTQHQKEFSDLKSPPLPPIIQSWWSSLR